MQEIGCNPFIESVLSKLAVELEKKTFADVLAYVGPLIYGVDDYIRRAVEELCEERKSKEEGGEDRRKLLVVLETEGGYMETVQRIVDILRRHYQSVEFVVPNHAMSAGTVLVMSGDAIHMDYYSVLGPIDPQVPSKDGRSQVPALGYLARYEELVKKSRRGKLTTAEMLILVEGFDQAELHKYEQARNLSITLLKQWLVEYKFKDWRSTRSGGKKVTAKMKEKRAVQIARILNDTKKWHTHGRGISMEVLRKEVKLEIEDFGSDEDFSKRIRRYYSLLIDYMHKLSYNAVLHTRLGFLPMFRR